MKPNTKNYLNEYEKGAKDVFDENGNVYPNLPSLPYFMHTMWLLIENMKEDLLELISEKYKNKSCDNCARTECKKDSTHKYCYEELKEWQPDFKTVTDIAIKYIAENHHPHTMIEIDSTKAILWEGKETNINESYIVD